VTPLYLNGSIGLSRACSNMSLLCIRSALRRADLWVSRFVFVPVFIHCVFCRSEVLEKGSCGLPHGGVGKGLAGFAHRSTVSNCAHVGCHWVRVG